MSFLGLEGKTFLVFGVANKKSVAYHIGKTLSEEGATVIYSVRSEKRLRDEIAGKHKSLNGLVHSIAFANYSGGPKPFHETRKEDFLQSVHITCYSLIELAGAFRPLLDPRASVVTVSISTTRMAAENYGFMAPAKAALDSSICFLAKSFSAFSEVRFNSVNAGLLKTSASAGIPGYIDSYLYAEKLTLRKRALTTGEVAQAAVFLLSERASGINAQGLVLDAGMSVNYFDRDVVARGVRPASGEL